MIFSYGETITVSRPGGQDRYGDPLPATTWQPDGLYVFAPRSSTELSDQRSTVIIGLTMYGPVADIQPTDTIIRVDGERFRVEGRPGTWHQPFTGWEAGMEVALEKVTG